MDDNELLVYIGKIYEQVMSMRRDEDYVVDPKQMDKFLDLVSFFKKKSSEYPEDYVEIEDFTPKQECGGVNAVFVVFSIRNEEIKQFCRVIEACSAVSIDECEDGIRISCTVPDIFIRKQV